MHRNSLQRKKNANLQDDGVAIRVSGLQKHFGDVRAVDGVDLEIKKGELFGLLGPNGAGKTTTINLITGLLLADNGNICVGGFNLPKEVSRARALIGFCPQEISSIPYLTGFENAKLFGTLNGLQGPALKERISQLFKDLKLEEKARKRVATYSGGMQRRLNIILAIIHDPEIIFLDEPTVGLDPQSRHVVWEYIRSFKERGKTVVLTTHYIEEADDLCDRVAIIDQGRIIAIGTPRDLKQQLPATEEIEFDLLNDVEPAQLEGISSIDCVVDSHYDPGKRVVKVQTLKGITRINDIINQLQVDVQPGEIHVRDFNLEDLFIQLTGHEIRAD
ncbi:MAG TPA: ABC transporter ATP-binding protein [Candidatus Lokiarchaeia archaeon]|nr:ABC transporter ATP-binding protein [Candidatus Lokiarchaeia archaeon]